MALALGARVRVTQSEYDELYFAAATHGLADSMPGAIRWRCDYERAYAAAAGTLPAACDIATSSAEPVIDDFEADGLYLDV